VAQRFPDVSFLIYHSGFVAGNPELRYDHAAARDGIDTLVRSLNENNVAPNSNFYAERGSTWRFLMRDPDNAAQPGEARVLVAGAVRSTIRFQATHPALYSPGPALARSAPSRARVPRAARAPPGSA